MTEREKILREGLERIAGKLPNQLEASPVINSMVLIARETIAKADAVPRDPRLPEYLEDDPWALQMLDYVDGLKAEVAKSTHR